MSECIHVTAPHGSDEWFQGRCGVVTASMFGEVRKRLKSGANKGDFSKAAHDYAFKLAVERISGELLDDPQFDSWQARRGREMEPEARMAYEEREAVLVEETGLALTSDHRFGASVDGLVDDDGSVEIKCYLAPSKLAPILLSGEVPEDVKDQVQGGMLITGRLWSDFVLYCPALKSINKHLTIIRVLRDEKYIAELKADLEAFDALVEQYKSQLEK